jgi:hypothetical protein
MSDEVIARCSQIEKFLDRIVVDLVAQPSLVTRTQRHRGTEDPISRRQNGLRSMLRQREVPTTTKKLPGCLGSLVRRLGLLRRPSTHG